MQRINATPFLKLLSYSKMCLSQNACKTTLSIKDMPRPKSLPIIGTKLEFIAAGSGTKLHEYADRRHKQLGPLYNEKLGGNTDLVFVSDPMLIRSLFINLEGKYPVHILPEPWVLYEKMYGSKRGLFFMNGEEWLNNRRVMNKYLLKENSENWFEIPVKKTVNNLIQRWKIETEKGQFIPDLETEFYKFSIDVIIAVMLGSSSSLQRDRHYEALLDMFSETVKKIFQTTTKLYGFPVDICQKLNLKVWREFKESVDGSLSLAHKIVGEILMNSKDGDGLINLLVNENVKPDDIKRIIGDFVIAAGDTTSYTSIWTLFLLSKNEKAREELYQRDSYINHVIKESMRLYPVAPFLTRILPKESIFGNYKLSKGTPIIASIYTSGRDEQYFSRANEYLPYRWDRNDARKNELVNHVTSASLPFALGARSCIGKKLAMLQMTELISQIVQNFEFECLNKDEVTANTSQVLVPSRDIQLSFTLRQPEKRQFDKVTV
ncbi:cytochrome P450 315a1, mitochondrial [Helicoverpa armigera]|uniref:cytochrome P450 315a1, mitochondrial n=1 Tax=Helicoverpa armigera TaxID=29058 RepID=UPI003082AE1D